TEPLYYQFLRKRYGNRFPEEPMPPGGAALLPLQVLDALNQLGEKSDLIYLHPSFGYFFETFYLEPHDLVYRLKRYSTNTVEVPVPDAALMDRQQKYWQSVLAGPFKELKSKLADL